MRPPHPQLLLVWLLYVVWRGAGGLLVHAAWCWWFLVNLEALARLLWTASGSAGATASETAADSAEATASGSASGSVEARA